MSCGWRAFLRGRSRPDPGPLPFAEACLWVGRRLPAFVRVLLELSVNGYIPRSLHRHWLGRRLLEEVCPTGVRLWSAPSGLYVPPEPAVIEHYRDYEPLTRRVIGEILRPGMAVADVGASIGYYSLIAGRAVGETGQVHAVEPYEGNIAFLQRNLELSGLQNVRLHRCAAAERAGQRIFHVTETSWTHGFYPHRSARTVDTIEVPARPLDEVVPSPVHVVKIAVQGAELEVLGGMRRILRENPRLCLVAKWHPAGDRSAGRDTWELPRRLRALGFPTVQVLDDRAGRIRSLESVADAATRDQGVYWNILARRDSP